MGFLHRPARALLFFVFGAFTLFCLYRWRVSGAGFAYTQSDKAYSKHLVVVTTKSQLEVTDWVQKELSDWPSSIYVSDDPTALYHPPENKGNEANVYLHWIIEHYDNLPDVTVFTHDHNHAVHIDPALGSNALSIRLLQLSSVLAKGYQNLRCELEVRCVLKDPNRMKTVKDNEAFFHFWDHVFPNGEEKRPEVMVGPCCAQFAVSKQAIKRRPKEQYQRMHDWLMTTSEPDKTSGRVFEYSWHVIFGKPALFCIDPEKCYCETYGLCNKNQSRGWSPGPELVETFNLMPVEETINE